MIRFTAFLLVFLASAGAFAQPQCPESSVTVVVLSDDTPGCATVAPAAGKAELNVTNQCGDDQFHIEAGVDCPACGPPLTLRMGTFGAFVVNTNAVSTFTPESPATEHDLAWARADSTGSMRVRVVPNITLCPEPDMGGSDEVGTRDVGVPEPDGEPGGCASAGTAAAPGWFLMLVGVWLRRRSFSVAA